jgi:hypothetical protein
VSTVRLVGDAATTVESASNADTEFAFMVAGSTRLSC